jgi:hypothetical protein
MCPPLLPILAVAIEIPVSMTVLIAGGIVVSLLVAIPAFKGLLDIIGWFRKSPPDYQTYATKSELKELALRVAAADGIRKEELGMLEERLAEAADERNRTLLSSVARAEVRMMEIRNEITHQLDQGQSLFSSLQKEQNSVASAVGELRGEIRTMREMRTRKT